MYEFRNDYNSVGHPKVVERLMDQVHTVYPGYGFDQASDRAKEMIQEKIKRDVQINFVPSGTSANILSLTATLKPYEGVVAAESGHIVNDEAGALEAVGHKVVFVESQDGKIKPQALEDYLAQDHDFFNILPKIVYISNSTELGTVYRKAELERIYKACQDHGVYLYIDGARMGSALMSPACDYSLEDLAGLCDIFTIGGTKNGALFGEAVVFCNKDLGENFHYYLKQHGVLTAKGFLMGLQYQALFTDDLYFENAKIANSMAMKLAEGVKDLGLDFAYPAESNQIFVSLPAGLLDKLAQTVTFEDFGPLEGDRECVRFVTTYHTKEEEVQGLLESLRSLVG
ncbi:MAG: aminotransferase class V-fold PLP-dependent enzyme [Peptoniphilus sp. oral taxon 375]|nr:aminotransferase class V-fold PLP-dependent enzyme [Peptoniphilus sp. oral taxon 375]